MDSAPLPTSSSSSFSPPLSSSSSWSSSLLAGRGFGSYWVITSLTAIEKIPLSKAYFMYESCLLDMLQMLSACNSKGLIGFSSPSLWLGAKFCFYQLPKINFVTGFFSLGCFPSVLFLFALSWIGPIKGSLEETGAFFFFYLLVRQSDHSVCSWEW